MDTRSKILTSAEAERAVRGLARPLIVVTGYFNVLVAEHARELGALRQADPDALVLVAVLPVDNELLSQRGRAEMVAALAVVDYVVIAAGGDPAGLVELLRPAMVVRWEAADAARTRRLIEHVHERRQTR